MNRYAIVAALALAPLSSAAMATLQTFAVYNPSNMGFNLSYAAATGLTSIAANNAVYFDIFNDGNAPLNATFSLSAATAEAATGTRSVVAEGFAGTFTFLSTQAFQAGGVNYGVGTLLLKGTFVDATLFGSGTAGGFTDSYNPDLSQASAPIVYTSAVETFALPLTSSQDFSFALSNITQPLKQTGGVIRNFSAVASGQFSSDPTPVINSATPEAATWSMLIIGFGAIGGTVRSRERRKAKLATA